MTVKQLGKLIADLWALAQSGNLWGAALLIMQLLRELGEVSIPAPEGGDSNLKVAGNIKAFAGSPAFQSALAKSEDDIKSDIDSLLAPHLASQPSADAPVTSALAQELFARLSALLKKFLGW